MKLYMEYSTNGRVYKLIVHHLSFFPSGEKVLPDFPSLLLEDGVERIFLKDVSRFGTPIILVERASPEAAYRPDFGW